MHDFVRMRLGAGEAMILRSALASVDCLVRLSWTDLTTHDFLHSADLMASFESALQKVQVISGNSKRLTFTASELAASMFSLRACLGARPHKLPLKIPNERRRAWRKLHTKLERYWKQAKRSYIRAHGREHFQNQNRRWKRLLKWLRLRLLSRRGDGYLFHFMRSRWWKQKMERRNLWRGLVIENLGSIRYEIPPPGQLCDLLRRARRSARNKYGWTDSPATPEIPAHVKEHVFTFVARRLPMPERGIERFPQWFQDLF